MVILTHGAEIMDRGIGRSDSLMNNNMYYDIIMFNMTSLIWWQ
uniref:Uncharacterized protein n=1 Tax=Ciona intestinalis TaxID=7719 RepID=H2XTP6_CIOIN